MFKGDASRPKLALTVLQNSSGKKKEFEEAEKEKSKRLKDFSLFEELGSPVHKTRRVHVILPLCVDVQVSANEFLCR